MNAENNAQHNATTMTPIIGGISITQLRVYEQQLAPDGLACGCPHLHALSAESYFVHSGSGRVEFHDPEKGMWVQELRENMYVQFPPGVLHRLISDKQLCIMALLSNAGLAEAGDARIWFGPEVDTDNQAYTRAASLPANPQLKHALARRDQAVSAYEKLVSLWHNNRDQWRQQLTGFRNKHFHNMAEHREDFRLKINNAHSAWGAASMHALDTLPQQHKQADTFAIDLQEDLQERFGMCGVLRCLV